jgi:hypothetical protein
VKDLCDPLPKQSSEQQVGIPKKLEEFAGKLLNLDNEDSKLERIQVYLLSENGDDTVKAHLYSLLNF